MQQADEARYTPPKPVKWDYTRAEIIADGIVHAVGVKLALIGVVAITIAAAHRAGPLELTGIAIYAFGLLSVLTISALYNLWPISHTKWLLRRFDHSAIYVLIAGTYTPFLVQLELAQAAPLLAIVWGIAAVGIALKLLFPGRFDQVAIPLYLAMGWSGVLGGEPLFEALSPTALWLIVIGGLVYCAGIVFHLWESLRYQNAIWHVFVLVGSVCLYFAVFDAVVLAKG